MTFLEDCRNPKSVSIIIREGTEHAVDELDRAACLATLAVWEEWEERTSSRVLTPIFSHLFSRDKFTVVLISLML